MTTQPPRSHTRVILAVAIAVLVIAAAIISVVILTASRSTSQQCEVMGESGPFGIRVLFDSNQSPVAGAQVSATNLPASATCNGGPLYALTIQTTVTFTTNNTEWYYLNSGPDAGYSVTVTYMGEPYNLTATFKPEYAYCATLLVPSGRSNASGSEFQGTCQTSTTGTTTSTVVTEDLPQFVFGIEPQPINASTETIPANTLAWTSWTMTNSTRMSGFGTQFPVSNQNYGSNITLAIYINGTLATQTAYTINAPTLPNGTSTVPKFEMGVTAFMVSTSLGRGTVVSLSVLRQTPLTAYVSDIGQSYETPSVSLPAQLPSSPSIVPYTIQMYAFSE